VPADRSPPRRTIYPARLRWWVAVVCILAALVFIVIVIARRS
jgi:hypothetical protein